MIKFAVPRNRRNLHVPELYNFFSKGGYLKYSLSGSGKPGELEFLHPDYSRSVEVKLWQNLCQELAELGFLLSWMVGTQWPGENRQQRNG